MILGDTGPLVALTDPRDPNHALCVAATRRLLTEPILITWPCFTEVMYFAARTGGPHAQAAFWNSGMRESLSSTTRPRPRSTVWPC